MISPRRLRSLRNDVSIDRVLEDLGVPTKVRDGFLRFLCPVCQEYNTATNPRTNLGRCFRCRRNFNPIDLVIVIEKATFLDAVAYVSGLLEGNRALE